MESALTPNTAAFFDYLSNPSSQTHDQAQTASITPSTLFNVPVPGRDTPEDTPPSATERSSADAVDLSDDSDERLGDRSGMNKRKAGRGRPVRDGDEMDEVSDYEIPSGHEDKRQSKSKLPNQATGSGRSGGRKSGGYGGEGEHPRELKKAERRKEQNRAAQKAFRERREARVKDLEEKLHELEGKAYGAQVENENLRGILKRLQEENVALKQSAFTFSMPVSGSTKESDSLQSHTLQRPRPPTPPQSGSEVPKTAADATVPRHRDSAASTDDNSPESLVSLTSTTDLTPPTLFPNGTYNFYGMTSAPTSSAQVPRQSQDSSSNSSSHVSPLSTNNNTEFDALWASLYPNRLEELFTEQQDQGQGQGQGPFILLNSQPDSMSFGSAGTNMFSMLENYGLPNADVSSTNNNHISTSAPGSSSLPAPNSMLSQASQNLDSPGQTVGWNKLAFREPAPETSAPQWDMLDNGVSDFLASLAGGDISSNNNVDGENANDEDDAFNAQLRQIFGNDNSPSAAFNLPGTTFSPGNYLNMSPSPLAHATNSNSNSSPQSSDSRSNTDTPGHSQSSKSTSSFSNPPSVSKIKADSAMPIAVHLNHCIAGGDPVSEVDRNGIGLSTLGPPKSACEIVHVVDEHGRSVKPSELWYRFGMNYESSVDHLLIDDLCQQMKSKATCKDGRMQLNINDAETIFREESHDVVRKVAHHVEGGPSDILSTV